MLVKESRGQRRANCFVAPTWSGSRARHVMTHQPEDGDSADGTNDGEDPRRSQGQGIGVDDGLTPQRLPQGEGDH